jgi:GR25 family glycosyltransferase involved in LPS biosynthesis
MGGEIGCALSHANVATEIANNGIEVALVLEDDIDISSDQELYLLDVYNYLLKISKAGFNFICHLGNDEILVGDLVKFSDGNMPFKNSSIFEINFKHNPIWTTHAYFVNVGAANFLKDNKNPVKCIADDWETLSNHNLNFKVLYCDPIFRQIENVTSTIGARNNYEITPNQKLRKALRKIMLELIGIRNLRFLKSLFIQFFN